MSFHSAEDLSCKEKWKFLYFVVIWLDGGEEGKKTNIQTRTLTGTGKTFFLSSNYSVRDLRLRDTILWNVLYHSMNRWGSVCMTLMNFIRKDVVDVKVFFDIVGLDTRIFINLNYQLSSLRTWLDGTRRDLLRKYWPFCNNNVLFSVTSSVRFVGLSDMASHYVRDWELVMKNGLRSIRFTKRFILDLWTVNVHFVRLRGFGLSIFE